MSNNQSTDYDEQQQQHVVMKYILSKLEKYAHQSHIWRSLHGPHFRQNLLRKSRHISKLNSISEDLVNQCINQFFTDVDQYIAQLYRLIYSQQLDELIPLSSGTNKRTCTWYTLQMERARQLFATEQHLSEHDLLTNYYKYVQEKLTPKHSVDHANQKVTLGQNSFDLNLAYGDAERQGKEYLKNVIKAFHQKGTPDLKIIDEMIKLGIADMKKIPSKEDFQKNKNFLGRVLIFHRVKESYRCALQNTSDDFMLLRFGKIIGHDASQNSQKMNKQFLYLSHSFLESVVMLFTALATTTEDDLISSISKIGSLFFSDHDPSIIKLNGDLFSLESNIDRWTWLLEQWRDVLRTMPMMFTQAGAFGRLVRTTIGIGLIHLGKCAELMVTTDNFPLNIQLMDEQLFGALQIGFYFGVAYAVVDCLQDEIHNLDRIPLHHFLLLGDNKGHILSPTETVDQWVHMMEQLLSDKDFDQSQLPETPLTSLLIESLNSLLMLTESNNTQSTSFNELALLLRSQRLDRKTFDQSYSDEQLYLGSVLKSHFTYTCTAHLGNRNSAREDYDRLWVMPFLGQLTDDCRDFNDGFRSQSVTPFTYYASLINRKETTADHLLNPFYTFLNLCSDVYLSSKRDRQTGAFLGRRIARTLYSVEVAGDDISFSRFLSIFCGGNPPLYDYFSNKMRNQFTFVTDPERTFFRVLDATSVKYARTNRKLGTYVIENSMRIEEILNISPLNSAETSISEEKMLLSAMNYSVTAGGKRLRPLLMLMVADMYGIEFNRIVPLLRGIEYLHTSSLIFDDLPAQDDSDLRRGRPSIHKTAVDDDIPSNLYEARAQLAAVDLIAVSMSLINDGLIKNDFPPERVNRIVGEISMLMHDLCIGQMMDLRAARVGIERDDQPLDQLDQIAWFKTGKTIEALMIMPSILTKSPSDEQTAELVRLRQLSRLIGILFQMRDDLLDVEESNVIGKPKALDVKNNTVTYVSILGIEGTWSRLHQFLSQALQLVDDCWTTNAETIKDVIRFIVTRKT